MSDRLAGNAGARSQDGNIVVVTSPDRKGYEVYEVGSDGLEMYFATIPVGQDFRIKDTIIRRAVQKHIKKYGGPSALRAATIRLAHAKPELRPYLLPLLRD